MGRPRKHFPPVPYDLAGREPIPGGVVRWVPSQLWRKDATRGIGRLEAINKDGTITISYVLNMGFGYKRRRVHIQPWQLVEYRAPKTESEKRYLASGEALARARRKAGL